MTNNYDTACTDDRYINAMSHLVRLLMRYEGVDHPTAVKIAHEMSHEGDDYIHRSVSSPAAGLPAAADAFMKIFGFTRASAFIGANSSIKEDK